MVMLTYHMEQERHGEFVLLAWMMAKLHVVLRRTPLPALYWLTDKVGGPRVQIGYNIIP
jgi:hypothetical protein